MKYLILFILLFTMLAACQQHERNEVLRSPEAPLSPDQFEVTDENFRQINQPGPRTFSQDGENIDFVEDKKEIKEAAEQMPDVEVRSISIEEREAYVTVLVHAPITNENERKDWEKNIKSAIEGVIHRYNIHVHVE